MHSLLDDDVWAFANCRVEAPGLPVAEIDWFFYNTRTGCLMLSEWKRFPAPVSFAADTGKEWLLANGADVPNPIEQVSRQLDAVRMVIRRSVLPQHFARFNDQELRLAQCVYSPQIDSATVVERIRFGKVYGTLEELASVVQTLPNPSPLLLNDHDDARLSLARALCALFRCSMSSGVEAKLRPAPAKAPAARTDVAKRVSEIHREIAKLHLELAELTLTAESTASSKPPSVPSPPTTKSLITTSAATLKAPAAQVKTVMISEHARMQKHLSSRLKSLNGSKEIAAEALRQAWRSVLADQMLHGPHGLSVSLFASIATPYIKEHHGSVQKLVGMQPRKWCMLQAEQAGLKPRDVAGKPSNIRVR
ncbi:hypothetical protein P4U43_15570 [Arthrobacter sp. EH-1B-1]|uniref:NERD domain-containing protein n=1 Tax=Arthrobacter vasquezii TaxID=2977629 RepID=A0ABT6CZA3_9MICC|nr:hypothetical protein [Arthrobacter vasquezii]MDF9279208.1 hypothetical protein [Arthrobacter vasquezii]